MMYISQIIAEHLELDSMLSANYIRIKLEEKMQKDPPSETVI